MKLKIEEHIKHRLIGIVVLVSIAMIFLPALMKQSNYRFDKKMHVSIKLPDKPSSPEINIPDKKEMFKDTEIVKIDIPHVEPKQTKAVEAKPLKNEEAVRTEFALNNTKVTSDAQPLLITQKSDNDNPDNYTRELTVSLHDSVNKELAVEDKVQEPQAPSAAPKINKAAIKTAQSQKSVTKAVESKKTAKTTQSPKPVVKPKKAKPAGVKKATSSTPPLYIVQLSSFSREGNAHALVKRLRKQGYEAFYGRYTGKNGKFYTVMLRKQKKDTALVMRDKLAASPMRLDGILIKV